MFVKMCVSLDGVGLRLLSGNKKWSKSQDIKHFSITEWIGIFRYTVWFQRKRKAQDTKKPSGSKDTSKKYKDFKF